MSRFPSVTVCLNRVCPRRCPQCGIADGRPGLSISEWIEGIHILKENLDVGFILFVGCEPLMFEGDLPRLIQRLAHLDIRYGFYSTSPEPFFSRQRESLISAGIENWSSGIDWLPDLGMDPPGKVTENKVSDSIRGLLWMANRGVQTHVVTTVHRQNLKFVPDIMLWCQENIPGVQNSLNFIEWGREGSFDFFGPTEDIQPLLWTGSEEERQDVERVMAAVMMLSRTEGMIIQTSDSYLKTVLTDYQNLSQRCSGETGPGVDCDGTLRMCGYAPGARCPSFNLLDLKDPKVLELFWHAWQEDLRECPGCLWIFPAMIRDDIRLLNPKSGIHQERWCFNRSQFYQIWRHHWWR